MGRRFVKKPSLQSLFSRKNSRSANRAANNRPLPQLPLLRPARSPPPPAAVLQPDPAGIPNGLGPKGGKKKAGTRIWMRFDRWGNSEMLVCDKNFIIKHAGIPARDLRILGPIFSNSSNILAREKAMVINLENIRAIVTAEELLLLDPLSQEAIPFVDQLKQQLPKNLVPIVRPGPGDEDTAPGSITGRDTPSGKDTGGEQDLPFEFQVLEIALEVVCSLLDSSATDLEKHSQPVLDELTANVSTRNLERVRSLKSYLTRLLARVQKVRDEIEHLLDDNEDMAHLYLTRKQLQIAETCIASEASNSIALSGANLSRLCSSIQRSVSIATSRYSINDVEELEMLLEAYFMQLDGIRNRILSVREYIDDTEDYINIQLDNQRNELIQLQLTLSMASFGIALDTYIVGAFAMNIPNYLYNTDGSLFWPFVAGTSAGCLLIFLLILGYAWWKKLLSP